MARKHTRRKPKPPARPAGEPTARQQNAIDRKAYNRHVYVARGEQMLVERLDRLAKSRGIDVPVEGWPEQEYSRCRVAPLPLDPRLQGSMRRQASGSGQSGVYLAGLQRVRRAHL